MGKMHLSLLSEEERYFIHQQTCNIIKHTGFIVEDDEILDCFRDLGAVVDNTSGLVRMEQELVDHLIDIAPSTLRYSGINGKDHLIGGDNRFYSSLILDPFIVDTDLKVRRPNLADVKRNTIIGQSLDRISGMMRMQYPVTDLNGPDSYLKSMEVFMLNTDKHISIYPDTIENCMQWFDAADRIAETAGIDLKEHPLLSVAMAVISPLYISKYNCTIMKETIARGYPILTTVCPMAGTTSPFSMAGTFLQANIEAIIPVLTAQAYRAGHPIFYGIGPSITDMKTGKDLYYKTEKMMFKIMGDQMGNFYNLPVSGEAGGSLTYLPDMQNGAESMSYLLASHACNQHVIGGVGSLGNANGMSSEQIIMQCGLIDMAEYAAKGVTVLTQESEEAIMRIGPKGTFLADDLTIQNLRNPDEFLQSNHLDLTGEAELGQSPSLFEKAHETIIQFENNFESPVPGNVQETIREYFFEIYEDKSSSNS